MDVEQAVPVIANVPAWVRRRQKRSRARRVIEHVLEAAHVDPEPPEAEAEAPEAPKAEPAEGSAPAVTPAKNVVDSAIFVGPSMPPYGAVYRGNLGDIVQQLASDLLDISGQDEDSADLPQNEVNAGIDSGGVLVLLSKRKPVAVYSSSFANNARLAPSEVTRIMRSLRYAVDVDSDLDDRLTIRTGPQLGSYTRTFTLGQILGRQPVGRRYRS